MIDVDAVRNWPFPELRQTYTARETILYGLALGYASDPDLESELRFVYERDLVAMPTMAVTLCHPGPTEERSPPRRPAGTEPDDAAPDHVVDLATSPQAALLYRQISDPNPLHADPAAARAAGFPRPILHGLCSYGMAARAVLRACAGGNPHALKRLRVRFSAPMYPGETLRTETWRDGSNVRFRSLALERGVTVMSNGFAEVAA